MRSRIGTRTLRLVVAMIPLFVTTAGALPPPPVSPAPITDYEYDAMGNRTKSIKAKSVAGLGLQTVYGFDALGRNTSTTDARSGLSRFEYDGDDRLNQAIDPRSLSTRFVRNGLGNLTKTESPDTGITNATFDANGNQLSRTDSRGVLSTYTYDSLNRLRSIVHSKAGQTSVAYGWTYDQVGDNFGYGVGRLTTATFPGGSTRYKYDAFGRVIVNTQTVASVTSITRYEYNLEGRQSRIIYPSGRVLTIAYFRGRPVSLSIAKDSNSASRTLISQIQWEPFGAARSWLFHMNNGTKLYERSYDQYGRLVRYPLDAITRDISYDPADRIVSYSHLETDSGSVSATAQAMNQSFGYDELGRLTSVSTPSSSWTLGYDANGNRTQVTTNGATSTYSTETTSNRLVSITNPTRSLAYDLAGNTLSDTGIAYTATYGLDNRLATLTRGGVMTAFNYDASGQRVRKVIGSSKPHFVYDQDGRLLGEYNSVGGSLQEFVWLGNTLIAVLTNSTTSEPRVYFAYSDHLNAPRVIVNSAGDVRWRWISDPFGSTAAETVPNSLENLVVNLRFPGQYADKETGLYYNNFRDYDSTTGRYVQSDPSGVNGGFNTYSYVEADPIGHVDPNGLIKWTGEMYATMYGAIGAVGAYNFDLKSDCVNGKYAYVHVRAFGVGGGLGANFTGGIGPGTVFDDAGSDLDPQVFNGRFQIFSAGLGVVITGGYSYIQLGNAFSIPSSMAPSPGLGYDSSVGALIGTSSVWKSEIKDCPCKN